MPITPPTPEPAPPERSLRSRLSLGALSPMRRELIAVGATLALGILVMPFLIWLGGNRVLGPYTQGQNTHAGALALLEDFFVGLAHGSAVFWGVALGPLALVLLLQLFLRGLRALPRAG